MANQKTTSVTYLNDVDKDELLVTYGEIQGSIVAQFISQKYKNTNYASTPTKGGTVHVKRFKSSTSQAYGTARAAGAANNLQNNGVDVKIDTDQEIAEEMSAKDVALYEERGGNALLNSRKADFALSMGVTLENAYFVALQTAAVTVDVSAESTTVAKIEKLIRTIEAVTNENVQKVDREMLVLTLSPEWFDALEGHTQALPNPLNGGVSARYFRRVLIEPAVRQTVDAVIQVMGSVAQPVVMGNFKVDEAQFSEDLYNYMPYFFGTKVVMTDLVFKCALDESISI